VPCRAPHPTRRRTARRDRPRSAGPRAVDPSHLRAPPCFPYPRSPRVSRRAARPVAAPPYWSAPAHVVAASPPTPHLYRLAHRLGVQGNPNRLGTRLYKRLTVLRARERHTAEPPLPPSVLTVNSTLRSLTPPARFALAFPRVPSSLPVRLLFCPSHQLTGVVSPAATAVGARRSRPPAVPPM
jgi:hypothetical protein